METTDTPTEKISPSAAPSGSPLIEHDVPITPRSKWRAVLDQMRPGDSVLVTFAEESALRIMARVAGMTVVARTIKPNQKRVWRTA